MEDKEIKTMSLEVLISERNNTDRNIYVNKKYMSKEEVEAQEKYLSAIIKQINTNEG